MAILTETKQQLDERLGAGNAAAVPLGGEGLFKVREAFTYTVGRYYLTVGFYGGIARYVSFAKDRLDDQRFSDRDAEVCLTLIAPPPLEWAAREDETLGSISNHQIALPDERGREFKVLACFRESRPYLFAYIPVEEEEPSPLAALVEKMNVATSLEEKVNAMAAVINELVAQRGE